MLLSKLATKKFEELGVPAAQAMRYKGNIIVQTSSFMDFPYHIGCYYSYSKGPLVDFFMHSKQTEHIYTTGVSYFIKEGNFLYRTDGEPRTAYRL